MYLFEGNNALRRPKIKKEKQKQTFFCARQMWAMGNGHEKDEGEGGKDVGDYGFRFRAGGEWFSVQVRLAVEERGEAYFGGEWEGRVVER